ncbi:MAG: Gfo/Idh/MocA family oxidoreductase, partial [Spirochaetaceae bacterium]|nr:Gfo/Idh/MocA family oxidoreductase [Spirochaetaceae bacterium]
MIRIGIVGCGRIISTHIKNLGERPEAEIVAICDVNEDALHAAKTTHFPDSDVALYRDLSSMLSQESLDAVLIATPHTLHFHHAMEAMDADCHVFLEKPMVTSADQAYALAQKSKDLGKTVAVGFNTSSRKT